jgi:hypothetical protein
VAAASANRHRLDMTILASPVQRPLVADPSLPSLPPLQRLLAGGLVATVGIAIFSIAIGNFVVGSSHAVVPAQGDVALRFVAATPLLVGIGLLHLLAAIAFVRGHDVVRIVAVTASGLMSLATAASAAMIAAGVDPFSWSGAERPSTGGIGLLVVAAIIYGAAAIAAGSGPTEG